MLELDGKVALVTGGGGGIGAAVARRLAEAGAAVAVCDLSQPGAAEVARSIGTAGGRAIGFALDVTSEPAVEGVVGAVEAGLGPIGVLVNVAGVYAGAPAIDLALGDWDRMFAVNARGVFLVSRTVARGMSERREGSIVTVASQSARVVRSGQAAYGASKAAASYMTKCLGLELAAHGIRCNVVNPGVTETPMARAEWDAGRGSAANHVAGNLGRFRSPIPLGKIGQPEDVAEAVLFLASARAGHITMAEILLDGGSTLIA